MINEQHDMLEDDCRRLGQELGLGRPVPEAVFVAAMNNTEYARNLFICRETPLIDFLLENPPQSAAPAAEAAPDPEFSTLELAAKASKSFWTWAKSGFGIVEEAVYERRLSACRACPKYITHPDRAAYKLVSESDKICAACGCVVSKKAKLPHETCPVADPNRPGLSKWGEPAR